MKEIKWRSILVLILIVVIVYFNWTWGWSVLFIIWVLPDFFSGVTYLMEPIKKVENPILYGVILSTWVLLSIFLLLDEFAPNQLPAGWSSSDNRVYKSYNQGDYAIDYSKHPLQKDSLFYKDHLADAFNIVGISTQTTFKNNEVDYALKELWKTFSKEDISSLISDIIDDKIYVIQSNFDENKKDYFTLTIGYKTASLDHIYKDLTGIEVKASKYAVVEIEEHPVKKLASTWEKIILSDLPANNLNNVEVFHYNTDNKKIEKIDLWISVPMSKKDQSNLLTPVKAEPIIAPYEFQSPKEIIPTTETTETQTKKYPTQQHKTLNVVGIQKRVHHKNNEKMNQSIKALWELFFQKDYSKHIYNILDYEKVYLIYSNYSENEVTLTLGYSVENGEKFNKKKKLNTVSIPSNEYYRFPLGSNQSNYGGKEWFVLNEVIEYRAAKSCDFEVYRFDENYKITSSFLWIGAK